MDNEKIASTIEGIFHNETQFRDWFRENYKLLGFDDIVKESYSETPDFIMLLKGENVGVELEMTSKNFIAHKHNINHVDIIVCLENNCELPIKTITIEPYNMIKMKIREQSKKLSKSPMMLIADFLAINKEKAYKTSQLNQILHINDRTAIVYACQFLLADGLVIPYGNALDRPSFYSWKG